jgi:hypothetical protein
MYALINNGNIVKYPASLSAEYPNTSFPEEPTSETLLEFGIVVVEESARPDFNPLIEYLVEVTPVFDSGVWKQAWQVNELDEIKASLNVRSERNARLSSSDWTQIADATVDKAAWAVYRQALRNVPDQQDFPFRVQWPSKPQ